MRGTIRWIGAWWLAGCAGDPCTDVGMVSPSLVLGIGEQGFERALEDGDVVRAETGSQGGHHIWPAVRTTGLVPGTTRTALPARRNEPTFLAELLDGDTLVSSRETRLAMQGDTTSAELSLYRLSTSHLEDDQLDGQTPVVLRVEGTDVCGTTVSAERTVGVTLY